MTVSGFTFIRNGINFDYPFRESIRSLLPFVDELIVAVGNSNDDTRESVVQIGSPKIRIVDTVWDESLRTGGRILAEQTNIALDEIGGNWGFYLQGDEVLHEEDERIIREALAAYAQVPEIEGLLFDYVHFYGSYETLGFSRRWYRREVRVVRNGIGVRSWGDAQGFRRDGKKLRVAHIPARIFHYGWVKPPVKQTRKLESFHRLWHPDEWVDARLKGETTYAYAEGGRLLTFDGSHPAVMKQRAKSRDWPFDPAASNRNVPVKDKLLNWVEDRTGWRIGEYQNYIIEDTFDPSQ